MTSTKYKNGYLNGWLINTGFKRWIIKNPKDEYSAFCRYCYKTFSDSWQEANQAYAHLADSKHKSKAPPNKDSNKQCILNFTSLDLTGEFSSSKKLSTSEKTPS